MNKRLFRRLTTASANGGQRGIAALEFAIVFPVLFVLLYGIITYALILVAQQSLTLAAAEGARAALRYTTADRGKIGCDTAKAITDWLGKEANGEYKVQCIAPAPQDCAYPAAVATAQCITIQLTYPYRGSPLVPLLLGPLMSVAVPETLRSSATVQID
jgi:Flp pilus assembly protein TadG